METACEFCINGEFDAEYNEYACMLLLDEDEFLRVMQAKACPYFRAGDEYAIVRKQN